MGAEGKVPAYLLVALGAGGGLRRRGGAGRNLGPGRGGVRVLVSLFEAPDGLADAVSQFRQAPGAEEQEGDGQDNDQRGDVITKHGAPLLAKDLILI